MKTGLETEGEETNNIAGKQEERNDIKLE